jgi:2-phospho-L-lactate transferase/gluconeogenesis factor (CofD/UPF0052 family)
MNILIMTGGTGSIALQKGLYDLFEDGAEGIINVKILTNAYDNGLSTGVVRMVCNGDILGPSDVRKNQLTRHNLVIPGSPFHDPIYFLEKRFSCAAEEAQSYILGMIQRSMPGSGIFIDAVNSYFSLSSATKVDYEDFSIANIIYAGLARMNNNSLREAAKIMAKQVLYIEDNVILNDDRSLFLGAITKSGLRISDEADIVSWNNMNDPFKDVFFVDKNGKESMPVLCDEAKQAIMEADLIILSSGTQWSSLIPTYASIGFKETISNSKAKIFMVMNRVADKDAPSQTASDIVSNIIPKYFPTKRVHLVVDTTGTLNVVNKSAAAKLASVNKFAIGPQSSNITRSVDERKHCSNNLAYAVMATYFKNVLNKKCYVFDYDDTLVGRGNSWQTSSDKNKHLFCDLVEKFKEDGNISICTGNSIKAVKMSKHVDTPFTVYADGGINKYLFTQHAGAKSDDEPHKPDLIYCVDESSLLDGKDGGFSADLIIEILTKIGIQRFKIESRGGSMIAIKPIDMQYRKMMCEYITYVLKDYANNSSGKISNNVIVKPAGRTTIEIFKPSLSKRAAIEHILGSGVKSLVYVGDELHHGNDSVIKDMNDDRITCLNVKNPAETTILLKVLTMS